MENKPTDVTTQAQAFPQQHAPQAPAVATPSSIEPRNFFATFLLTLVGGYIGLRHFYLGDKKLGWLRAGLFVGGYVWIFAMAALGQGALSFLGSVAVLAAIVWAVVDFFYVYFSVKTDADGQPLVSTKRDLKWAKVIFWVNVITFVLVVVISVSLFSWAENQYRSNPFQSNYNDSRLDNSLDQRFENNYRFDSTDL